MITEKDIEYKISGFFWNKKLTFKYKNEDWEDVEIKLNITDILWSDYSRKDIQCLI